MFWIVVAPPILFALVALADFTVTCWVEVAERQRRRRYAMRTRKVFAPVVIQGGKAAEAALGADAPAVEARETKTA
jgi:hypothetical protein